MCDIDSWWGEAVQHKLSWVTRDVLAGVKREGVHMHIHVDVDVDVCIYMLLANSRCTAGTNTTL